MWILRVYFTCYHCRYARPGTRTDTPGRVLLSSTAIHHDSTEGCVGRFVSVIVPTPLFRLRSFHSLTVESSRREIPASLATIRSPRDTDGAQFFEFVIVIEPTFKIGHVKTGTEEPLDRAQDPVFVHDCPVDISIQV
jgi:hypothetical protein